MNDLFPDLPPVLSPRLAWLQEHDVTTFPAPLNGREGPLWEAWYGARPSNAKEYALAQMQSRIALATSEEDAIIRLAERNGWPLWNM